jgi:hypothetical protein
LAHAIQNSFLTERTPNDSILRRLMREKNPPLILSDAPTMYGTTNIYEFWTESLTSYVYANKYLKTSHPKIHDLVEEYLDELKIDKRTIKIAP